MISQKLYALPNGWDWARFGDVATLVNGRAYAQEELLDSGTPVLRIQNLNGGNRWYFSDLKLGAEKYCDKDDLLYAWSATFGPYWWKGPKAIYHYHIWKVLPGSQLNKRYAYYALRWISNVVKAAARGVTMVHMTKAGMEDGRIPLPPLSEQQRIADILDQADALRSKRRAAIAQLDTLTQAIFLEMFGDPATNPKGWPTRDLASLGRQDDSISYGVVQPGDDVESGIPIVRVGDLAEGKVDTRSLKRISPAIEQNYKRSRLHGDEVLISCVGSVGVVALADASLRGFNIARAVARLRLSEHADRTFVASYLGTPYVQSYFTRELRTVSQPTLNIKQLAETPVPLPPLDLQREFARRAGQAEHVRTRQHASLAHLDMLFASLQHRAFRGEL